ncbi:Thioredoxin [Trema orientale]|uniref:Thioredoxin n=1 Tax=Trema orientale TaxID=63057 RepID=A0A2P5FPP5_TREOI|nr:Thioredoxin [Trema orientale]
MALENCLQVSTTRVGGVQCHIHSFSSKEKLNLPTFNKGLKKSALSYSSLRYSKTNSRKPLFVCKAREALDQVQVVTESTWNNSVIASENPVLVEFWAPWCGPCRMIAPVIDELAKEYSGKINCYKLNTDDSPNIATQYGIRSIPTVLFFKNGEKKESVIGAVPKSTLSATIEKYVEQ